MASRLSIHFQNMEEWGARFMEESGALYYKVMDCSDDPCPGKRAVYRLYKPDWETNALAWEGAAGARKWIEWAMPIMDSRRWAWALEDINEPQPMDNPEFRKRLNEFTVEANAWLGSYGWPHVGLNFGVGWPDWGHGRDFKDAFEVIDYWGPHEYNAKSMGITAPNGKRCWVGRYQETKWSLKKAGIRVPPIFFGEYGIDLGVTTPDNPIVRPEHGWQFVNNDPAWYINELAWADRQILMPDRDVKAAFVYTAGPGEPWGKGGFGVTEDLAMNHMVPHLLRYPPSYGSPIAAPEIKSWIHKLPQEKNGQFQRRDVNRIDLAVVHHTGGKKRVVTRPFRHARACASWHISKYKRDGVLYHFMFPEDGRIIQTQPIPLGLAHHAGDPDVTETSISLCFMGNKNKGAPSGAQLSAAKAVIDWLGVPAKLHSGIVPTSCPAGRLDWGDKFIKEVNER
jgi:hypothetical protein